MIFILLVLALLVVFVFMSIKIVPQARESLVERFGRYMGTLQPGLNFIVPFFDKLAYTVDLREQVVSFPPQQVITEDNLTVGIDTVLYFQVTDSKLAIYENVNYVNAIEQLTMATLRNIIGKMSLETALTSRETINNGLRGELDTATGKWGIRVNRVELKSIEPPQNIKSSMEQAMRADREKRAAILTAEGASRSAILEAEGAKQSAILRAEAAKTAEILRAEAVKESSILEAEGVRQASILKSQGEAQAIIAVSQAIHDGNPDQKLLAYKYLDTLPELAKGENNTTWVIPAELTKFLHGFTGGVGDVSDKAVIPADGGGVSDAHRIDLTTLGEQYKDAAQSVEDEVERSRAEVPKAREIEQRVSGAQPEYAEQKRIDGYRYPQQPVAPQAPAPPQPVAPQNTAPPQAQPPRQSPSEPQQPKPFGDMRLSDFD